ncbi:MAG: protein kinase [Actinomycetota bacterium]
MVGTVLAGRYRLHDRIAIGGMGSVYEATDERLDGKVAVKLLKEDLSADPRFVERFRREARAAAALTHPNIAAVYDYGVDGDHHFIAMEFVEGRDLARLLREEGALEPERAAHIGAQIAFALSHAHKAGVVHRDVKPGNVIVSAGDRVKVTDFGIARAVGDSTLTATGTLMGTAQYISPEQAIGQPAGPASDIYAAGIVVCEILTGAPPFSGDSPVAIAMRHASGELPVPSSEDPRIPAAFDMVIARATAKDPGQRYADAEEFGNALSAAATPASTVEIPRGDPADPLQTVWPIPGDRWHPERIGRAVVIGFLVLGAIAAALLGYRLTHNDNRVRLVGQSHKSRASGAAPAAHSTPSQPVLTVPTDLVGRPYDQAETELRDRGLTALRHDASSGEVDPGSVIYTNPGAGTPVSEGDTITVFVSAGEDHGEGHGPPHVPPGHDKHDKHNKEHD